MIKRGDVVYLKSDDKYSYGYTVTSEKPTIKNEIEIVIPYQDFRRELIHVDCVELKPDWVKDMEEDEELYSED